MHIKKIRQTLKSLADDTRLRIINLLNENELNVADICIVLEMNQPSVSKHLTRLRLTGLVSDRREGQYVYYYLTKLEQGFNKNIIKSVINERKYIDVFKKDIEKLKKLKVKEKMNG